MAALRNDEALPALVAHGDAEALQQVQRDRDVGLRDQLAHHFDGDVAIAGHQAQRLQQPGEELARHIAAHTDRRIELERVHAAVAEAQWRVAILAEMLDRAAQRPQRVHQVADGPLVHARHAADFEAPALR